MTKTIKTYNDLLKKITQFFFGLYLFYCFFEPYINTILSSYGKYLIFLVIVLTIASHRSVSIRWYHVSMILWLMLKLVSIYWVGFNDIVQLHLLTLTAMVMFFIVTSAVTLEPAYEKIIIETQLYSSFALGILSLFFSQPFLGKADSRLVITLMGAQMDPNNQSAFLIIGVAIAIYKLYYKENNKLQKLFLLGVILVNIYGMFLTGSRGGIVSLAALAVFAILFMHNDPKLFSTQSIKMFIVLGIFGGVALLVGQSFLPEAIFERLFGFGGYEGGSERTMLWSNAIEIFIKNPLIGGGWGKYWGYNDIYRVVHNTYISELADGGILGFLFLFSPVIYVGLKSLRLRYFLPDFILIMGLMPSLFLDTINKRFFWNAIIVSIILLNIRLKNQDRSNHKERIT